MKKVQIVIASTLKPVDDPRSYDRFGLSMAKTNKYAINIIGFGTKNKCKHQDIHFTPLGNFHRLSIKRWWSKWRIYQLWTSLKPDLIVVQTHELLIPAVLYKIIFQCKVIYDIRENYFRNIYYQNNFPPVIKHVMASLVRLKEISCSNLINAFILAESGYENEFKFHKKKQSIVIENKVQLSDPPKSSRHIKNRFIFTGNLSKNSGVMKAIDLFESVQNDLDKSSLLIIGHCPSSAFFQTLKNRISSNNSIELIGGASHVDHQLIIEEICKSSFGLVTYNINPSNENCMPTKVYEYLALGLPFISEAGASWTKYAEQYGMTIPVNLRHIDGKALVQSIQNYQPTTKSNTFSAFTWEGEETKLLQFVSQIIG